MSEVWEVKEKSRILVGGEVVVEKDELTVDDVMQVAKSRGIKKFVVKDSAGRLLSARDFPFIGEVTIESYNEAK